MSATHEMRIATTEEQINEARGLSAFSLQAAATMSTTLLFKLDDLEKQKKPRPRNTTGQFTQAALGENFPYPKVRELEKLIQTLDLAAEGWKAEIGGKTPTQEQLIAMEKAVLIMEDTLDPHVKSTGLKLSEQSLG